MQCHLLNGLYPGSFLLFILSAFYTFNQIQASKSSYPCNQDCLWDGSSFQEQGFGWREGYKGMKTKRIHLIILEGCFLYQKGTSSYQKNESGSGYTQKGQAIPQDGLITDQRSLPNWAPILKLHKNKDCFFSGSQLVPVANKRDAEKNESPGWNEAAKDCNTYA